MDSGHCGLIWDELCKLGATLLEVPEHLVRNALEDELISNAVIAGTTDGCEIIFLAVRHRAEEGSMIDVMLMPAMLKALPASAALLIDGDVDQWPPVGPGQVLKDIIASHAVPVVTRTEVFRQAATSLIVTNAHKINAGQIPDPGAEGQGDFSFVASDEPGETANCVLELVAQCGDRPAPAL